MIGYGLAEDAFVINASTFTALTGFSITIPNSAGISQFSVHSLEERPKPSPRNYTLQLSKDDVGDPPPEWISPSDAQVRVLGGSLCVTNNNTNRSPVTLTLRDLFEQPGDFVVTFTVVGANKGKPFDGKIIDENGTAMSFQSKYLGSTRFVGELSFENLPRKSVADAGAGGNVFTITRRGTKVTMTGEGLAADDFVINATSFKTLAGFSITLPSNNVGISQFSVRSLSGSEDAGGSARSSNATGQGRTPAPRGGGQ